MQQRSSEWKLNHGHCSYVCLRLNVLLGSQYARVIIPAATTCFDFIVKDNTCIMAGFIIIVVIVNVNASQNDKSMTSFMYHDGVPAPHFPGITFFHPT